MPPLDAFLDQRRTHSRFPARCPRHLPSTPTAEAHVWSEDTLFGFCMLSGEGREAFCSPNQADDNWLATAWVDKPV